jgi:hypothetical protein
MMDGRGLVVGKGQGGKSRGEREGLTPRVAPTRNQLTKKPANAGLDKKKGGSTPKYQY